MRETKLSIIILSYNTEKLLQNCLDSLEKVKDEIPFEIIISDNGSSDGSVEMVKKYFSEVEVIENGNNLGFARGNNAARNAVRGEYILFLNSDTEVGPGVLAKTVHFLEKNLKIGALGCKEVLANGELDKDARRSFPTPWVSLTHLVLKLDKLFPTSPLFARYWYGYRSPDEIQEVDVLQGAFFLTRKKLLDEIGWFDEDYFLDGEDIDLSWKIKNAGYKVVYYPKVSILHLKGASKGKSGSYKEVVGKFDRLKYRLAGVNSMEIFYKKRLWSDYPLAINFFVLLGIYLIKAIRTFTTLIS